MDPNNPMDFTRMVEGYIDCAIWTCADDLGIELGPGAVDGQIAEMRYSLPWAPGTISALRQTVADFLTGDAFAEWLAEWTPSQAGHDLWLTRNGHGAGFWDRGLAFGGVLTSLATPYGAASLYLGDDDLIYLEG